MRREIEKKKKKKENNCNTTLELHFSQQCLGAGMQRSRHVQATISECMQTNTHI
jgi:hypothetical protein